MAHSPGDWDILQEPDAYGPNHASIVAHRGGDDLDEMVAEINYHSRHRLAAPGDPMANARLIKASPKMLAVLKQLVAWEQFMGGWDNPAWKEARNLVAQIEGREAEPEESEDG